ncbi:MAG: DUF1579 domain-containing protein [Planctomycetes bacterium]|nr:DUF1579 domain-containing protein [Planctomycetota bacterium]
MKNLVVLFVLLFAASPFLLAEDKKPAPAAGQQGPPQIKTKEHEALQAFVGDWESVMKMDAIPGVPGFEKATESKGTEHAELVCDGLWLKWTVSTFGTHENATCDGLWLAGYDSFKKTYVMYWVDSNEPGPTAGEGRYDAATKSWEWKFSSSAGPMRSVLTFKDKDNNVEVGYLTLPDGKEAKFMEITRKRGLPARAVGAAAKTPAAPTPEHANILKSVGEWETTMVCAPAPGQQPTSEKGIEQVSAICGGKWVWSDYKGQFMGQPYEGHALVGYDSSKKKYVSYWFDIHSTVPVSAIGDFDAAKKSFNFEGKCVDPTGKPSTMKEVETWKDDNTRHLKLDFQSEQGATTMEITYKRKTKK